MVILPLHLDFVKMCIRISFSFLIFNLYFVSCLLEAEDHSWEAILELLPLLPLQKCWGHRCAHLSFVPNDLGFSMGCLSSGAFLSPLCFSFGHEKLQGL